MEFTLKETRAFIALDLPLRVREAIAAWGETELADPALRRVPVESIHITLAFLGRLGPERLKRAAEVVCGFEPVPVPMRLESEPVPVRGGGGGIRLYALSVVSAEAIAVQSAIEEGLLAAGVHEPEERPFWPHATVARVRRAGGKRGRPMAAGGSPGGLPDALCEQMFAVRITLYRSETKSAGAEYTPLAQVELPQPGSG